MKKVLKMTACILITIVAMSFISCEKEDAESIVRYDNSVVVNSFKLALNNLYENGVMPDGTDVGYHGFENDIFRNHFAIYDIDFDGKNELIIEYTSGPMVAMMGAVYGYNTETEELHEELRFFPSAKFYTNGVVIVNASHNQGPGQKVWPHSIYGYASSSDNYSLITSTYCREKSLMNRFNSSEDFPDEFDSDKDGVLYYGIQSSPVDKKEYDEYYENLIGNSEEIIIPYMSLTQDNIELIN